MVRAIDKPLPLTVLGLARCHMGIRSLEVRHTNLLSCVVSRVVCVQQYL